MPSTAAAGAGAEAGATSYTPITATYGAGTGGVPVTGWGTSATSAVPAATASSFSSGSWMSAMMWGSSLIQTVGTLFEAKAQADAARYAGDAQASVYETNALIQRLRAEDAIRRGDDEAKKAKEAAKRLIGSQRASMGAQGIDIESGSALDIQKETAELGAMDALTIKNNAWREAWGLRAEATNFANQAQYTRLTAKTTARNTVLTGGIKAATGLATSVYKSRRDTTIYDYLSGGA